MGGEDHSARFLARKSARAVAASPTGHWFAAFAGGVYVFLSRERGRVVPVAVGMLEEQLHGTNRYVRAVEIPLAEGLVLIGEGVFSDALVDSVHRAASDANPTLTVLRLIADGSVIDEPVASRPSGHDVPISQRDAARHAKSRPQ